MRNKWKQWNDKAGNTWVSPSMACPFSIKVGQGKGKHVVYDVRLYTNGGATGYKQVGESLNIGNAQNILRRAWRAEQ